MEKKWRNGNLFSVVVLIAFVLLAANFEGAHASDITNDQNSQAISLVTNADFSSINQTGASNNQTDLPSTNQTGLSDFLIKLCEYQSRGNATVLARLERECIQQEKVNQAIDHRDPPQSPVSSLQTLSTVNSAQTMDASWNTGYFKSILGYSQYMNDTSNPPNTIGKLDNPSGVTGDGSDDDVTYYETSGWYQNPNYPYNYVGGEAPFTSETFCCLN